jgi:hypothetical protein
MDPNLAIYLSQVSTIQATLVKTTADQTNLINSQVTNIMATMSSLFAADYAVLNNGLKQINSTIVGRIR